MTGLNIASQTRQAFAAPASEPCRLARGTSVNDIAEQLAISNKTVSTHKARLMDKMGLASTADLVRYAVSHRLIA